MNCIIQRNGGYELREVPVKDRKLQWTPGPKERLVCGSDDAEMLALAFARLQNDPQAIEKAASALAKRGVK